MKNPFNPGYYQTRDLLALGFGSVGTNVKIAKNSTLIGLKNIFVGNNVRIDGFTSIIASTNGQCIIGNNVHIGGGSGVIKDIPDNTKVMGYPAKDLKKFIRENKWLIKQL